MDQQPDAALEPERESEPSPYVPVARTSDVDSRRSGRWTLGIAVAVVLIVGLAISQIAVISSLSGTQSDLDAALEEIASLESQLDAIDNAVSNLDDDVAVLTDQATTSGTSSTAPVVPTGTLPQFEQGTTDAALGMTLGTVEAPDAYSDATLVVDPADGTKRLWMVWAHWCPYCQEELPSLSAMHADLTATYPDVEVVTVTTSIDPSRGNPLPDYLEAQQFPFPVLVDETYDVAGQLGVSAFPFWVVTDGDGTVLYRVAGYLGSERVVELVSYLDAYEA